MKQQESEPNKHYHSNQDAELRESLCKNTSKAESQWLKRRIKLGLIHGLSLKRKSLRPAKSIKRMTSIRK